jgi:uncharacterized protein
VYPEPAPEGAGAFRGSGLGANKLMASSDTWEVDDEIDNDDADDVDALDVDEIDIDDLDEDTDEDGVSGNISQPEAVKSLSDFVAFMVGNLVDDPDAVEIMPEQFGQNVHIKIIVPEAEMGRVIGRQGRIARSMRTLLTIAASRKGLRASLDIDS